ncbi:DUF3035 domain-containing protein, partial [Falsiroseomonas oryziterrae]|uniref:DUF3035 domain-containing protein n=1 Tax=Falsiroseomonas oryziterrae TaxID=2911368 RepID=UPI001F3BE25F
QEQRTAAGLLAPGATAASASPAERALVARAGGPVEADIRRQVDQESLRLDRPSQGVVDRMMFWQQPPPPGIAVDPTRESQRLREAAALGRDPTEGETPIVQPRPRSWFRDMFGL